MLEDLISDIFTKIGHAWKTTEGYILPNSEDVQKVLDAAATRLYDEDVNTRLETGGLIIDKTNTGLDVYMYVGSYK